MKKIGDSFKGILGGFVFILIGIGLLWWNEGNNVKNIKTTAEMEKNYIQVSSETVDSKNEGKLIATNGNLLYEEELKDEIFNVSIVSPYLKRIVEVYQWQENEDTTDDTTTYNYEKVWSSELIDSSEFHQSGHDNAKSKPYEDNVLISNEVKLGAFRLPNDMITSLEANKNISTFDTETITSLGYSVYSNYVTNSSDLANPQIGDIRISFVYPDYKEASVLATQTNDTFTDYISSAGKRVSRIKDGIHTGEELIKIIETENKILKWVLRLLGVILCVSGVAAIFKPISTISNFVPILGGLVNSAVGLVSLVIGLIISLVVIAIAWIAFRPVVGISLLAVAAVLVFFLIKKKKTKVQTSTNEEEKNM